MSHLTLEALARLVDEAPEAGEASHLSACPGCREELEALREQTVLLSSLPRLVPPPDAWPELRERLREERLLRSRAGGAGVMRAAAAVVLFLAGGAAGYALRSPGASPLQAAPGVAQAAAREPAGGEAGVAGADRGVSLAADPARDVEQAEQVFRLALDRFMTANPSRAVDPAARLAALDNIVLTTAEALKEAPADPVINGYYLTAVAQRDAVLRQIQASSAEPVF